jgi:predicted outer membrane protein
MFKSLISAVVLLSAVAANASAQAVVEPQTRPLGAAGQVAGAPGGEAAQVDQAIATCLALGNQEEIALAQFAESRAKHDNVKEFVAMMLKDHRAALEKLYRTEPQLAALNLQLQTGQGSARAAAPAAGGIQAQMVALQKRVTEECLALTEKELGEHDGAIFDRCYMGQQMGGHIAMLAKLRGSKEFASAPLRQFIDEATKTVESHLAEAKKIAKALEEDSESGKQARRDDEASRK